LTSALRKQVYDLTLSDLESCPVWEFASDEEGGPGQDEATVRPYEEAPPITGHGGLIVRAAFVLADGSRLCGYLSPKPETLRTLGYLQPVMICDKGQVNVWNGIRQPSEADMARDLSKLGRCLDAVFPVQFRTDVEIIGGPIFGELPGFLFLDRKRIMVIRADGMVRPWRGET
jgi:hypothetical protein